MLRGMIAFLRSVFSEFVKLKDWCRNPTNGKGKYVTPSQRQYMSSGMTFVAILVYRTGEGLYNLVMSLIFDILAPLINAIIGIGSDLWHSNPNYTRKAFWGVISVLQMTLSLVFVGAIFIIGYFRK